MPGRLIFDFISGIVQINCFGNLISDISINSRLISDVISFDAGN